MDKAPFFRWDEIEMDHPIPLIDRRRIYGEQSMVANVFLHKGFHLDTHFHANEQISLVISGHVRFGIGAEGSPDRYETEVRTGEAIIFPANCPHSADALEDSQLYDVFSPPSAGTGLDEVRDRG